MNANAVSRQDLSFSPHYCRRYLIIKTVRAEDISCAKAYLSIHAVSLRIGVNVENSKV